MHVKLRLPRQTLGRTVLPALLVLLLTGCGVAMEVPVDDAPEVSLPTGRVDTATQAPAPPAAIVTRTPLTAPTAAGALTPVPTADVTSASCGYARVPDAVSIFDEAPSGRLIPPSSVSPAAAFARSPLIRVLSLEMLINDTLGDERDSYAVYVQDLATGRGAVVNGGQVFYAASVFKLTVMYEVFNQIDQGLLTLDDELVITPYYDAFGLGPRRTAECEVLTVGQALQAMMGLSDNAVAVLLQDLVGAGNINASMAALGLTDTRLLPEDLPLTASDVAVLLDGIAHGEAVSAGASSEMLRLMITEEFDNGMKAGVPSGTLVAHKTGNWSNATHDAGIVYAPGVTYLLVVLSDTNHDSRVIQAVSSAVYTYFTTH